MPVDQHKSPAFGPGVLTDLEEIFMQMEERLAFRPRPVGLTVAMGAGAMTAAAERLWKTIASWPAYPWNLFPLSPVDTFDGVSVIGSVSMTAMKPGHDPRSIMGYPLPADLLSDPKKAIPPEPGPTSEV